jgi:hypothetical protein
MQSLQQHRHVLHDRFGHEPQRTGRGKDTQGHHGVIRFVVNDVECDILDRPQG